MSTASKRRGIILAGGSGTRLQGIEVSLSGKDAEAPGFKAAELAGDVFP